MYFCLTKIQYKYYCIALLKYIQKYMRSLLQTSIKAEKLSQSQLDNSTKKNPKTNSSHTKANMNHNNKDEYIKKFFQRRLQIQMEVRNRVFKEALAHRKGSQKKERCGSFEEKQKNFKKLQKQRVSYQDGKHLTRSHKSDNNNYLRLSHEKNRKPQTHKCQTQAKNNLLSSCGMTTKITKEGPKTETNIEKYNFHLDLKDLLEKKNHRSRYERDFFGEKRFYKEKAQPNKVQNKLHKYFGQLNQLIRKNKKDQTRKMESEQFQYQYNPECQSYIQRAQQSKKLRKQILSKRMFEEDQDYQYQISSAPKRLHQQNVRGRSNGFKYQINEELREKLAEMLAKQRLILQRSQKNGSYINALNQNHNYRKKSKDYADIKIEISSFSNLYEQSQNSSYRIFDQNVIMQLNQNKSLLSLQLRKETQKMLNSNEGNQSNIDLAILNEGQNKLSGQILKQEVKFLVKELSKQEQAKQSKQQQSQILCAICQTNITHQMWKHATFYSKTNAQNQYYNYHQIFQSQINPRNPEQSRYAEQQIPLLLHCGHSYHKSCLQQWFKYKTLCPLCKADNGDSNSHLNIEVDSSSWHSSNSFYMQQQQSISIENTFQQQRYISINDYYFNSTNRINSNSQIRNNINPLFSVNQDYESQQEHFSLDYAQSNQQQPQLQSEQEESEFDIYQENQITLSHPTFNEEEEEQEEFEGESIPSFIVGRRRRSGFNTNDDSRSREEISVTASIISNGDEDIGEFDISF